MKPFIKKILWPIFLAKICCVRYLRAHNPAFLFSLYYKQNYGVFLNYQNPKSFYDKIGYLEFFSDTSKWSRLSDKVNVRNFVKEKGLGDMLNTLYGVYHSSKEIDYNSLPNTFVLKTNNGSATNILVNNKKQLDIQKANKQLDEWLKIDYGYETAQPHYSKIEPLILAERFLIDENTTLKGKMLIDYKFYCVNGKPMYVQVLTDRVPNTHKMKVMVYDIKWNAHPEYVSSKHNKADLMCSPYSLSEMKSAAQILAEGLSFVRVDFYEINGKPIFGEMTFTPGFDSMTIDFFNMLGKLIVI